MNGAHCSQTLIPHPDNTLILASQRLMHLVRVPVRGKRFNFYTQSNHIIEL